MKIREFINAIGDEYIRNTVTEDFKQSMISPEMEVKSLSEVLFGLNLIYCINETPKKYEVIYLDMAEKGLIHSRFVNMLKGLPYEYYDDELDEDGNEPEEGPDYDSYFRELIYHCPEVLDLTLPEETSLEWWINRVANKGVREKLEKHLDKLKNGYSDFRMSVVTARIADAETAFYYICIGCITTADGMRLWDEIKNDLKLRDVHN